MPNGHGSKTDADRNEQFKDATENMAAAADATVNRVAVRLPPFWPEDPEVWFVQAEAQFQISGIKEDTTKFYHVISQLDQRYIREIKDIVRNPPPNNKYEKLKQELTKRLSISRQHQITQLLSHEELGDRKPSQFLRHLKTLAADGVTDEFLRSLWSSRLPPHVQAIIVSQTSASLEDAAELADKICEVTSPPLQQIATASSSATAVAASSNFDSLLQRIDDMITSRIRTELSQRISQLDINQRGRRPSRSGHRSRCRSRSRTPGVCWYHNSFGDKAKRCRSPCGYKSGNHSGSS